MPRRYPLYRPYSMLDSICCILSHYLLSLFERGKSFVLLTSERKHQHKVDNISVLFLGLIRFVVFVNQVGEIERGEGTL